jgi:hypothetical protein
VLLVTGTAFAQSQSIVRFRRATEAKEGAFTILVPDGWQLEGGVLRLNPMATNGAVNTIGAKFDFTVRRDANTFFHWHPTMTYKDPRGAPGFAPGSTYMGMTVYPILAPEDFLMQAIFPRTHSGAQNLRILDRAPLPELVRAYERQAPAMQGMGRYTYQAAMMTVAYQEGGAAFKEKLAALIENSGQLGLGMWSNKETLQVRATAAEFDRLAPLFTVMQTSIRLNPEWLIAERRGADRRAAMARETQAYVQQVAAEIADNRRRTNAEIAHSMWLTMTQQADYVNPYTGETELGSNQWKYRWINGNGEIIYTDDPKYDPNWDQAVQRKDYKRSQPKPR